MKIGTRTLQLLVGDEHRDVPITLFAPKKEERGGWFCRYTIDWPHERFESEGWGKDALQAISLTLNKIGNEIYASAYHESGQLIWEKPGGGYGFPVTKSVRAFLVGEDARFDG